MCFLVCCSHCSVRMVLSYHVCFFFFFKQKTAYEMRISDWSSDVCSSDLVPLSFIGPVPKRRPDDVGCDGMSLSRIVSAGESRRMTASPDNSLWVIVTPVFKPAPGGGAIYADNLARARAGAGAVVVVFAERLPGTSADYALVPPPAAA